MNVSNIINKYKLEAVLYDNYDSLCDFLSSFPEEERSKDFWMHRLKFWWDNNPAFHEAFNRGWIIKHEDRIVGFYGNIPLLFQLNKKGIVSSNGTTWHVLPEYKSRSILLFRKLLLDSNETILFSTTPRAHLTTLLKKFGFQSFPQYSKNVYVDLINLRSKLFFIINNVFLKKLNIKFFSKAKFFYNKGKESFL